MMQRLLSAGLLLGTFLPAQTILVPNSPAELNSVTVNPFSASTGITVPVPAANRTQFCYDASHFTSQNLTTPVLITRMRVRVNGANATWTGGTIPNELVDMSTTPFDYTLMSAVFDDNHGSDRTTVYNGPITVNAGSSTTGIVGTFEVDIPFTVPFLYYPALGDLTIDFMGDAYVGSTMPNWDYATASNPILPMARRSFSNLGKTVASGTTPAEGAMLIEFTVGAFNSIYAAFDSTARRGVSPLQVSFTDQSWTPSPAGIVSWAWDFDGDSVIDSTLQNPSFTFGCGDFPVSLTVNDGVNLPQTVTRQHYVVTDEVVPGFTWQALNASAVQFTDTTAPAATSWAWDFDGDSVIDSTLQNPVWSYGTVAIHDVTLTASRLCGPFASVQNRVVPGLQLETTYAGGSSGATNWANLFDLTVLNPKGIDIKGFDLRTNVGVGTPFAVDIYVTPGTCVGNESNNLVWRRVAQGTGISGGNSSPSQVRSFVNLSNDVYLAPGSYGVMIHHTSGAGQTYSGSTTPGTYGNADVTFSNPEVRAGLFSGTLFVPRVWNGTIYYATANTSPEASYGFFGLGCAGTMGTPANIASSPPRLGQGMAVQFQGLPNDLMVLMLGFSRSNSTFGPLPLDLTAIGAPGCFGRVSNDYNSFLLGSSNAATWNLAVPNLPALLSGQFFTQGFVFDLPANALGLTTSDAAAAVIGR